LRLNFVGWPGAASDVDLMSTSRRDFWLGILWPEQEHGSDVGLNAHERPCDALRTQKTSQKKWPLRRAAKFREETPRKGGGLAIEDRDTALQQYADVPTCLQGTKYNDSRQNAAESLEKLSQLPGF
jgi:hypothetical protein